MNRRTFLKGIVGAGMALTLPASAGASIILPEGMVERRFWALGGLPEIAISPATETHWQWNERGGEFVTTVKNGWADVVEGDTVVVKSGAKFSMYIVNSAGEPIRFEDHWRIAGKPYTPTPLELRIARENRERYESMFR